MDLAETADPEFVALVAANLAYWQARAAHAPGAPLDGERANLLRAIEFGVAHPQTAAAAAALAARLYRLVERHADWQTWLPLLTRALAAADGDLLRLELLVHLGLVQQRAGRATDALATHGRALALAEALDAPRWRVILYAHLAELQRSLHDWPAAEATAQRALAAAQRATPDDARILASIYNTLGVLATRRGEYAAADDWFARAAAGWRTVGDAAYLATTLANHALVRQRRAQRDAALALYDAALAALADAPDARQTALIWINKSLLYIEAQAWAQAEACLRAADSPALRRLGDVELQAMIANNLGYALRLQGRPAEAIDYLAQAVAAWQVLGNALEAANSTGELALAHAALGATAQALALLDAAIAGLRRDADNVQARQFADEFAAARAALLNRPPA